MVLFKPGTQLYSYEIVREEGNKVLYINYIGATFVPSIAENPDVMARTIDLLTEATGVSRIVFVQQRNYSYNAQETFMLQEISSLHIFLTKQEKLLAPNKLSVLNTEHLSKRYNDVAYLLLALKNDPVACYVQLKAVINTERKKLEEFSDTQKIDQLNYIKLLEKFFVLLKNTELIKKAEPLLDSYDFKREIYHSFFRPEIIPNFTFTRLVASLPEDGEIIDQYKIGEEFDVSHVTILKRKRDAKFIYHLMPPDNSLAKILVRHTIGFGLIEVLLQDEKLQDIVLNAPISANNISLRHQEFDECITN